MRYHHDNENVNFMSPGVPPTIDTPLMSADTAAAAEIAESRTSGMIRFKKRISIETRIASAIANCSTSTVEHCLAMQALDKSYHY